MTVRWWRGWRHIEAAAESVQNRKHFDKAQRGLAALEFDQETKADTGCRSQLVLTEALCTPGPTDDGTNLFDCHSDFPDREYHD